MNPEKINQQEMLSVIIPVFNEEADLEEMLDYFFSSPCPIDREWVIVDDASTDRTLEILREAQKKHPFQLVEQNKNLGKGAAVRAGLQRASGNIIVIQDADFEYDPHDIPSLLEPILKGHADVVFGSRFKKSSTQVHRTYHYFINQVLTWLSNLFSGVYLTDMETCYKVLRADLIKSMKIQSQGFGIEVELTAYVAKTKAKIFELPIRYYPRTRLQGKKINWRDGIAALVHLIRFNVFTDFSEAFTADLPKRYSPYEQRHAPRRPPNA